MIDPILPAPAPPPATTLGEHAEGEFSVFTDLLAVFSRVVDERPPGQDGSEEHETPMEHQRPFEARPEEFVLPIDRRITRVLNHEEGGQLPRPITQIIPVPQPHTDGASPWPFDGPQVEPAPVEPAPAEPVPVEPAPVEEEPVVPAEPDESVDQPTTETTVDLTDRARLHELLGDRPALRPVLGESQATPRPTTPSTESITPPAIDLAMPAVKVGDTDDVDLTGDLVRLAGDLPASPAIEPQETPFTPPFADAAQPPPVDLEVPMPVAPVEGPTTDTTTADQDIVEPLTVETRAVEQVATEDGAVETVDGAARVEAGSEPPAPARRPIRPLVSRLVERIESWIRRTENMPPPRTMTLRGAHLDGMTIRVSMAANGLMIQVEGADGADINWIQQVGEELTEHGFEVADISEYQEEGDRRPLWDEEEAQRRRERRAQRFASHEELREMVRGGSR